MHRAETERKDLKVHFKNPKPVILSNQSIMADNIDLMPIVRLLSSVSRENSLTQQAI